MMRLILSFQGFDIKDGGGILLISSMVKQMLNMECAVLMGANIANEVASEQYCEATIGRIQMHIYVHPLSLYWKHQEISSKFKNMQF